MLYPLPSAERDIPIRRNRLISAQEDFLSNNLQLYKRKRTARL